MMKNNKILMLGAALLMIALASCRSESDRLMTYDHADKMAFDKAQTSFAEKFKILWNGLNQNYALWDFEAEHGIDWDAVYDEYLPQFEALDRQETVTDDELLALVAKVCSPLHDGHMAIYMDNHKTGSKQLFFSPNTERVKSRDDFAVNLAWQSPQLGYYANVSNGEVEVDEQGKVREKTYSTRAIDLLNYRLTTEGVGAQWMIAQINELSALPTPTVEQTRKLEALKDFRAELGACINGKNVTAELVNQYNDIVKKYEWLQVPEFDYIDPGFTEYGINLKCLLLKGNIAYLYLSDFHLTAHLADEGVSQFFNANSSVTWKHVKAIRTVYQEWFDTVQKLHKNGTLGGVIIDVRNNGGGLQHDAYYLTGSLLPAGGYHYGYARFKRGTGRYDYSVVTPQISETMEADKHEVITEPVVIMTNCNSLSMSELTTLIVRSMDNGTHIGKTTKGGICGLSSSDSFSFDYMGYIGVKGTTPIYVYLPQVACLTLDHQIIEGVGIKPDIEVNLDLTQLQATGRDTQLDRALQFLRTGK